MAQLITNVISSQQNSNATLTVGRKETHVFVLNTKSQANIELYNSLEKMVHEEVTPTATNFPPNLLALLINSTVLVLTNGVVFLYNLKGITDNK